MGTYEAVLQDVTSQAIIEAAQRFTAGDVPEQSRTFAPSVAEFVQQARRQEEHISIRDTPRLPAPRGYVPAADIPGAQHRMRLKMPMWRYAYAHGRMDELAAANEAGFGAMVVLASKWGIKVPQELLDDQQVEDRWRHAHNRAIAEIERNPPPCMRKRASA
jgi:hypothetical protein